MIRVIPYHYTPSVRVYKNNKTNIMRNGKCNFGKKIQFVRCYSVLKLQTSLHGRKRQK